MGASENSLPAKMSYSVLIKVLHEAAGHIMTCETNTDKMYHGKLSGREDNINCRMSNIAVPYREGPVAQLEQVYIRDINICFVRQIPYVFTLMWILRNLTETHGGGEGKKEKKEVRVGESQSIRDS